MISPDLSQVLSEVQQPGIEQNSDESAVQGRGPWAAPFVLDASETLDFDTAIERVEAALRYGIDPSLEGVRAMLEELGHPERAYACVQVAGTNGKTSTTRYTAALLRAHGLRVGLYVSPHLVEYTERVEIDGTPVDRDTFARGISWALCAWGRLAARGAEVTKGGCTEFELLTVAAFVIYAEQAVDVAVLEVGLGGRWDATSAADQIAVAVTGIGLDHTHILGDTLGAIATEKAAVIQPGRSVVLGTNAIRPREVLDVMLARCRQAGCLPTATVEVATCGGAEGGGFLTSGSYREACVLPTCAFEVVGRPRGWGEELVVDVSLAVEASPRSLTGSTGPIVVSYDGIALVAPEYQAQNIACALALATSAYGRPLDLEACRRAIAGCPTPGRFDVVSRDPFVVLDACHNPQSCEAFATALVEAEPDRSKRPTLVLGALSDKDHRGIVDVVAPLFEDIVITQSDSPRALPAEELAREVAAKTGREPVAVFGRSREAVEFLAGKPFVGCGTITLIGELTALIRGR